MFQKNSSAGFVEIVVIIIIVLVALFSYLTFMTKDKYVPESKIKERLSIQFQDRFVKLECVGNNQEFHYITNEIGNDKVEPENALITFKAKIKIDGIDETVVGSMKVNTFVSSQYFVVSFSKISFSLFLDKWHFVKKGENIESYCSGDSPFSARMKEKPYQYRKIGDEMRIFSQRFTYELDIQKKLCEYGHQKSCKIIEKWEHRRSSYRIARHSDKKYQKEKLNEVFNELFAKKYYKRFCDNNASSSACDELEKIYKSD